MKKKDDPETSTGTLNIIHTVFIEDNRTADYQTTKGISDILSRQGNKDDLLSYFEERRLPVDEITANELADEILIRKPELGYLTISNALQWRLQYARVIEKAGTVSGILRLR